MRLREWHDELRERLYELPLVVLAVVIAVSAFVPAAAANVALGVPVSRDGVLGAALICVVVAVPAAWGWKRRWRREGKI